MLGVLRKISLSIIFCSAILLHGCVPHKRVENVKQPSVGAYVPVFEKLSDFPQLPGAVLEWRKITRSQYGPFVEAIYGSNLSWSKIQEFYQNELDQRLCYSPSGPDYHGAEGFDQSWRCVVGYDNDTSIFVGNADRSEHYKNWVTVQFGLSKETPGLVNSKDPADRGTVTVAPIDDAYRIRRKKK